MHLNSQMQTIIDQFSAFKAPPLESLSPGNARNLPSLKNGVEEIVTHQAAKRMASVVKPMPKKQRRS